MAEMLFNEERANYGIDQWQHYKATGRLRGGQPGTGPF